jgi:hypothetical protein
MSAAAFTPDGSPIRLTPSADQGATDPNALTYYTVGANEIAVVGLTADRSTLDLTLYNLSGDLIATVPVDHAPTGESERPWAEFALHNGNIVVEWTHGSGGNGSGTDALNAAVYAPDGSLVRSYVVSSTSPGGYPEGSFATAAGYQLYWLASNAASGSGFDTERFDNTGSPTTGVTVVPLNAPLTGASALGPGGSFLEVNGANGTYSDGLNTYSFTLPIWQPDRDYFPSEAAVRLANGDYAVAWDTRPGGAEVAVFHTATRTLGGAHGVPTNGSDQVHLVALPDGGYVVSAGGQAQSYDAQDKPGSVVQLSGDVAGTNAGDLYTVGRQNGAYVVQNYAISHPDRPTLALSGPGALAEGSNGATDFAFTVTRSGDDTGSPTVDWYLWTDGHTGSADSADFSGPTAGTVYFRPGQATATIHIAVNGDTSVEPDEAFHIALGTATGATTTTRDVAATIVNDDVATGGTGSSGSTFNSDNAGDHWTGTSGNDTFNLGRGGDVVTGNGGADVFKFAEVPWAGGHITDFGATDSVDLTGMLTRSGYTGSTPISDGYLTITADSTGSAQIWTDPHNGTGSWLVATLDGVSPNAVRMNGDVVVSAPGQTYTSDNNGDHWTGTAGNDTFHLGRGGDVVTSGAGADTFAFAETPWAGAEIKDFSQADGDVIDLSGLLARSGYTGSDPFADQYLKLTTASDGSAQVWSDIHAPGNDGWWLVATLDGVSTSSLHYSGGMLT